MLHLGTGVRERRFTILVLTTVVVSGCTSWRAAYPGSVLSPLEIVQVEEPSRVRITRQRGAQLELHDPFVVGDSIVGEVRRFGSGRVAVPLGDIQRMELRSGDGLKNTGLVILAIPVSLLLTIMIACAGREVCS